MRFHQLTISAFGPFAGTESVDFEELNAGGLFLLTGPTGAGKTSVLDAICFALFGSVPGARGVKTLKSHHADPEARPEVALDFSIGGRRFLVRRSPEWSRPKRKGSGVTTEKASASLIETTGGTEHFVSSRAQEVGHLVSGLVGMRASQFVQVAMLPQGEFAKFLRADSQDRHDVLQQLFRTDRFTRIEDWVHERSRTLRDRAGTEQVRVLRALDAIADRAAAQVPDELSGEALAAADPDQIRAWAAARLQDLQHAHTSSTGAHARAVDALQRARAGHEQATRAVEAVQRRDMARAARDSVPPEQEAEAARSALEADARAARCLPVLALLDGATETCAGTAERRRAADRAVDRLQLAGLLPAASMPDDLDGAARLTELGRALREQITRAEALLPREQTLIAARSARADDAHRLEQVRADLDQGQQRLAALPTRQQALRDELSALAETAAAAPVLDLELAGAREALEAARQLAACRAELEALRDGSRDARDRAADARDRLQDLVARRLAGMAAELAGRLADDVACPVCGSAEHPAPARPAADAVTETEQTEAAQRYDRLTAEHTEASNRVVAAERRLESLLHASGGCDAEQLRAQLTDLESRRLAAERAAAEHHSRSGELHELENELADAADRLHELDTQRALLEQALVEHDRAIREAEQEVAAVLGDDAGASGLGALLRRLRAALATVESAERDVRADDQAGERVTELAARAEQVAVEEQFGSAAEARKRALDEQTRAGLTRMLATRTEVLAQAEATLTDPAVSAVADLAPPDLARTQQLLAEAEARCAEATKRLHQHQEALAALTQHQSRLEEALADWAPARDEHERAASMARLVRGTGSDNYLQMRLSAYVLATRLDQVLEAANERLDQMRDQRYLLERTGKAARRNAQAGLGLQVLDSWTGEVRDPSTLSGGESFVVSLSLALGLADVVTQEAGGAEIDTLFVDEGFGTLDADTLDDVMDRLDGLRAGGRSVGVVSHVHELRSRIPTQLHVEKRRNGSSLLVRTLTA